ncbi:hypothetical protein GW7_00822 [Heterocephalus glaber]|uniref:Uncharacterized protein C1orf131 homolog n=1 Tax=Heterocephalus glaber TaxID=10181 RepID=G5BQJ2_HETGA|nr:uncharacterized protein C1orf131 homolog [Heterocephalus glaber]EHB11553.1 hypothetical protein GW7_00822 [Heterocephalus glaber]
MAPERLPEPGCEAPECTEKLLDALLQTLYDVGEKEDETEQKRIRKKRDSRKRDGVTVAVAAERTLAGSLTRGKKKSASSFFRKLREELNCAPVVTSHDSPSEAEVSAATGSPSPLQNNREQVEVVEFHSRNKKRKLKPDQDEYTKTKTCIQEKDTSIQEFNLEKARLEVHRFGITGYGKGKERVLERERAIMLGAEPPKNSYVNYKVLQEQIKEKKEEEKRVAQDADIFKKKKRREQEDRKSKKKKPAPSILSSGQVGQVGKFKNGTLILSPFDIKKINSSRVAK